MDRIVPVLVVARAVGRAVESGGAVVAGGGACGWPRCPLGRRLSTGADEPPAAAPAAPPTTAPVRLRWHSVPRVSSGSAS